MKDMKSQRIAEILKSGAEDTDIVVKGWVRTKRGNKNVAFIALNDGSCVANIQIVVDLAKFGEEQLKPITTGACIRVDGRLVASLGSGQRVEVQAEKIEIYGTADPETYPLQKKRQMCIRDSLSPAEKGAFAGVPARHRLPASAHQYLRRGAAHPARHGLRHSRIFQQGGFLLLPYAAYHGFGLRGRRRHVSGDDARPERRAQE